MNFACDQCHKVYTIGDDKVAGRRFRVTCKQCSHVISVDATAVPPPPAAPPAAARPVSTGTASASPPAAAPAPPPPGPPGARRTSPARPAVPEAPADPPRPEAAMAPPRPASERPTPTPAERLGSAELETTDQQALFFASEPTDRPRHTALWQLADRKGRSYRWLLVVGVAGLAAAGGTGLWMWSAKGGRLWLWPPEASTTPRRQAAPAPAAAPLQMPAMGVQGKAAETAPQPAELPPEAPLEQRGAAPPRPVGGQAGFESVGSGGGPDDAREKLRRRNLSIGKKDKKLLDLLEKKKDASPAVVARGELDTGRPALDEASVRQTMASNQPAFGACVTRSVKENPKLRVDGRRATLMLTIRPSGVVTSAWVAEADLDKSPLGKCLVAAARRVVFPAFSGEPLDVSVPLALTSTF